MSPTPAKTLAALRQLACLGLPGKSILPEAFDLLRALVGLQSTIALHLDNRYRVIDANIPVNFPLSVLGDYAENFHCRAEGDGVTGMTIAQAQESRRKIIHTSRRVGRPKLVETAFWNRILRPVDFGWTCQMPLRDGRRPLATIILARPFRLPDYSAAEIGLLERAQPWFCHALANTAEPRRDVAGHCRSAGESGVLVLDATGTLLSASPGAIALLLQATGVPLVPNTLRHTLRGDAGGLLRSYANAVGKTLNGFDTPLPAGVIHNDHGTFHLRAYALDAFSPGMPTHVSLHIERHVPPTLRLFRSSRFLALTTRERDVCMGLLAGRPQTEIARHLGIQPSSVIHHAKSLYRRLDIGGRKELLPALLDNFQF